jgi:hypothetical protein
MHSRPSWPLRWLIRRIDGDRDALAGDLLEEFQTRQSRAWLWRQIVLAVVTRPRRRERDVRLLKLVENPSAFEARSMAIRSGRHQKPINLSGGPVPGIGGLSLVALGTLMALVSSQLWWVIVVPVIAGGLLGIARILVDERTELRPRRGLPTLRRRETGDGGRA